MKKSQIILITFIAVILSFYYFTVHFNSKESRVTDFAFFYASTQSFLNGENIYTLTPFQSFANFVQKDITEFNLGTLPNLNPPFQTLLFLPFGLLSYSVSLYIWSLLSLLCGLISVGLINRYYFNGQKYFLLALVLLVYFPTWITIKFSQFSLILLLLLCVVWIAVRNKNKALAGILLGVLLNLKVFTGIFLFFFAVKRKWNLLAWYLGSFLALNLISLAVFGIDDYASYINGLRNVYWQAASWNASISGFLFRLIGGPENGAVWDLSQFIPYITYGFSFTAAIFLGVILWREDREENRDRFDVEFSLSVVMMLLLSPLGWMYYFAILIIPLIVLWRILNRTHKSLKLLLLAAWGLSTIPHDMVVPPDSQGAIATLTWAGGFYFYALVILMALLIYARNTLLVSISEPVKEPKRVATPALSETIPRIR
jgi:hypothetical protein